MTVVATHPLACILAVSLLGVALGVAATFLPDRFDR